MFADGLRAILAAPLSDPERAEAVRWLLAAVANMSCSG